MASPLLQKVWRHVPCQPNGPAPMEMAHVMFVRHTLYLLYRYCHQFNETETEFD